MTTSREHHTASLYNSLHATAEAAGIKIISDERCCQLLAWLLVYGGGNEAVVCNYKLNADIRTAQKRLNVFGGESPNTELLPLLKSYVDQLQPLLRVGCEAVTFEHPEWVVELCSYYGLYPPSRQTA